MRLNGSHREVMRRAGVPGNLGKHLHLLAHLEILSQHVTNPISCRSFAKFAFISRANIAEPGQPEAYEQN